MNTASSSRFERLSALRAEVQAIESAGCTEKSGGLAFGVDDIDRQLTGGGLALTALHEIAGDSADASDDAAATLFIAGLAARAVMARPGGTVLWALARRDLFAPGLAQAGLTPDRLIHAEAPRDEDVLAVMEEGLRHGGLAAVVGEVGRAAMACARRLQLAAEEGGTMALMLRRWRKPGADPLAVPSVAATRWRIACVPSAPLAFPGLGRARWRVALVRQRGGPPHEWMLEAFDAEARLALAARSGDRPDQAAGAPHSVAAWTRDRAA